MDAPLLPLTEKTPIVKPPKLFLPQFPPPKYKKMEQEFFENINQLNEFKAELKELLKKHKIKTFIPTDDFRAFAEGDLLFTVNGEIYRRESVEGIILDLSKK